MPSLCPPTLKVVFTAKAEHGDTMIWCPGWGTVTGLHCTTMETLLGACGSQPPSLAHEFLKTSLPHRYHPTPFPHPLGTQRCLMFAVPMCSGGLATPR